VYRQALGALRGLLGPVDEHRLAVQRPVLADALVLAAFEVADAALCAGAVAVQAPARARRRGLADAGDVDGLGLLRGRVERVVGRAAAEAADGWTASSNASE